MCRKAKTLTKESPCVELPMQPKVIEPIYNKEPWLVKYDLILDNHLGLLML